ncbi:MAG TPA: hypothetical protein GXZ90_02190 [Clostridiales bacterium]|nr:hypothetical protein [Clostridiales bacterium]
MYNEEQKIRYLNQCKYEKTTIETIKNCFVSVSQVEYFYKQDLSEFNQPQINDMLKKINSRSRSYLTSMCIFFADYYNWCLLEGLVTDPINKYDVLQTKLMIENILPIERLREKYFNKELMLKYIDKIYDVTNQFLAYALYRGVKGYKYNELINLKLQDIDEETKTVKLITGRIAEVDDLFIKLAKKADRAPYYNADGSTPISKFAYYGYTDADYILKPVNRNKPTTLTLNMVVNRLSIIKSQSENSYFTTTTIFKNGLINYILEKHRRGKPNISLEKILFDQIHGKLYTYDKETEVYIEEFGSLIKVRMLRRELADFIDCFK